MDIFRYTRSALGLAVVDALLAIRALPFLGSRYQCPCCGWRLRAFTHGGLSLRHRPSGYCPRCNAKSRHRRDWLLLESATDLFTAETSLLHVSPKYALARRLVRLPNIRYLAGDIKHRPHVDLLFDVTQLPMADNQFDAVICIHVLEHVVDDRAAINEIFRVLRPGGWAFVSAPIRLDQPTFEDPAITDPEARREAFGETDHVRWYGSDLRDRLEAAGFSTTLHRAGDISESLQDRYGLLTDENVFICTKPEPA